MDVKVLKKRKSSLRPVIKSTQLSRESWQTRIAIWNGKKHGKYTQNTLKSDSIYEQASLNQRDCFCSSIADDEACNVLNVTYLMFTVYILPRRRAIMAVVGVVKCPENAVVVKFKVKEGSVVSNGTLLCEYRLLDTNKCCRLKSNLNGTVKELLAKEGDELQYGYHVI